MEGLERDYGIIWERQRKKFLDLGVYDRIVKLVELKDGGSHLDVGCFRGDFLERLAGLVPEALLIGVDQDIRSLLLARERSELAHIYGSSVDTIDANTSFARLHTHTGEDRLDPFASIHLVCDDMREPAVLANFVGVGEIDSTSYLFPGGSTNLAFEKPSSYMTVLMNAVEADISIEQAATILLADKMVEVRRRVWTVLINATNHAGSIVLAERTHDIDENTPERIFEEFLSFAPDWKIDETDSISVGRSFVNSNQPVKVVMARFIHKSRDRRQRREAEWPKAYMWRRRLLGF